MEVNSGGEINTETGGWVHAVQATFCAGNNDLLLGLGASHGFDALS